MGRELPVLECRLDAAGGRAQRDRYARIGAAADRVERSGRTLTVEVRSPLVDEAIRIERECCPFFSLAYDGAQLTITVDDAAHEPALDAIEYSLRRGGPAAPAA